MQSSSTDGGGTAAGGSCCGDDQEYDSRSGCGGGGAESISAFFNPMSSFSINTNNNTSNSNNMGGVAPLQLYSFSNGSLSFAHQVSNYFDHPQPTNFIINHHNSGTNNNNNNNNINYNNNNNNNQADMVWPNKFAAVRPSISTDEANCTAEGRLGYSIPNNNNNHNQQQQQQNTHRQHPTVTPLPSPGPPAPVSSSNPTSTRPGRNPKKRSRVSRRAPTTVLTTDTNNFRQMVQEFTGIPASPFNAFSPRARFDLYGGLGGHFSSTVPAPPSYLLRPSPQKIPPLYQPPYLANSSLPSHTNTSISTSGALLVDGAGLAAAAAASASLASTSISTTIATPTCTTTFHLCDPQEFLSTNPQLTFQSLLQSSSPALLADQQDSSMSLGCTTVTPHQSSCSVNPAGGNCSYRGGSSTFAAPAAVVAAVSGGAADNNGVTRKGE
ncbi:hypothetical protein SOVF_148390, partial [Spinacia oleracea]